jgi:xanthine dehydrogenase accessory factor
VTVFYQYHAPAVRLVVVGAGNDVIPLVDMASLLGWEATVVDGRSHYARPERFANACQVLVAKPEEVLAQVSVDDRTVFALMTHNYNYDKALLRALTDRRVRYVAMLGPHKKIARMLDEFAAEGNPLDTGQLGSVFSPAGLDIGAENAEEIALSIVAEIQAFLTRREGIFLRGRPSPIHG